MITPRATRLVRVPDLQAFRAAVVRLSRDGPSLAARDRLIVVPTHAAAALLTAAIEDGLSEAAAILPDLVTPRELTARLGARAGLRATLGAPEREALLGSACRAAVAFGAEPPFRLRPGLVAEIVRFYDELRYRRNSVDEFERRTLDLLEPGAATDRGAERLVRQTRFLASVFRDFERRTDGRDEHGVREALLRTPAARPCRHVVVAVADEAFAAGGLRPTDWDLLTRVPGLERLDVVVTDGVLAGPFHERVHRILPGIEEVREPHERPPRPVIVVRRGAGGQVLVARDREEEVAGLARRLKAAARNGTAAPLGRVALVVRRRLPYVYLARDVLRAAGVPCQTFDALPLAAEPFAAALDLVLSAASANFARAPAVALLRSPHWRLAEAADVAALDRQLADAGYLGEISSLERLLDGWRQDAPSGDAQRALRGGERLLDAARQLARLQAPAPLAEHLANLIAFVGRYEAPPPDDEALRAAHLRARGAVLGTLTALRDAYARADATPVDLDGLAALVRRWIEGQTFAPRVGTAGVYVIDSDSARFGRFDEVHLAGVVEGEWPERPRRNVFYSPAVLRELGWPSEADRLSGARAAFADLLLLPGARLSVSVFALEADAPVSPSALVDEVERAGLEPVEDDATPCRIFDHEALSGEPVDLTPLDALAREWADRRLGRTDPAAAAFHGFTAPPRPRAYALSALERYQDCPFRYFAAHELRLEEDPEDEATASPRARGRFIHELLERFFEAWDARGDRPVTPERLDAARSLMEEVASPLLERLPLADAALERLRLFGSAIAPGIADLVLELEVGRPAHVQARWLERRLDGVFGLGEPTGRRVALRGVADRVDLLEGRRLRVIDYKSGRAPDPRRAFQAATYALCAREILEEQDGAPWSVDEVGYVALAGQRPFVPVRPPAAPGGDDGLDRARARLLAAVDGIEGGRFPPRPHDTAICDACPYATVCRKDYVRG